MKKILITGGAGFIGYFLSQELLRLGFQVVGLDNLNDYYDPGLKQSQKKWGLSPIDPAFPLATTILLKIFTGSSAIRI